MDSGEKKFHFEGFILSNQKVYLVRDGGDRVDLLVRGALSGARGVRDVRAGSSSNPFPGQAFTKI